MVESFPVVSTAEILKFRPPRNTVDPHRPYEFLVEPERSAAGEVVTVATLFLTNSECPFHCLMCDLWQNTLERTAPSANIAEQIEYALNRLPPARQIKLYNSGNFFDPKAISPLQYPEIAKLVTPFERVIVENHPKLVSQRSRDFRDAIAPAQLEVALGLETSHPEVLAALNKEMTLADYDHAVEFYTREEIPTRTFILLKPPFLTEEQGIEWAIHSIKYAFDRGVRCCSLVPTRAGNGIMEQLAQQGDFQPPTGASMEFVLATGINMRQGRVFMDLWDAERFFPCDACRTARIDRLNKMNLTQTVPKEIACTECAS